MMSKGLIGISITAIAAVALLCVFAFMFAAQWFMRGTPVVPIIATAVPTLSAINPTRPPVPTNAPAPTATVVAASPTQRPNATAIPRPAATIAPTSASSANPRAPQTLSVSEAQASGMIAERIEAAKMPLKDVRVIFHDNQTIELLGTAQVKMPIIGNVAGPLKVMLQPVVRNEKLEAEVTRIQFNGVDITEAYKTNVELGVNQAFEGILGNRRVQQASISNQRLVVTVLP
ncbi:MAG: hypothetical protein KGS46_14290 [Chloroflexi bacterium]|nr:hypothetical protein [Chloroflexota bacterium]